MGLKRALYYEALACEYAGLAPGLERLRSGRNGLLKFRTSGLGHTGEQRLRRLCG